MSRDVVIQIEDIAKRYRLGGVAPLSSNLRADLTDLVRGVFRPPASVETSGSATHRPSLHAIREHRLDADPRYFWALKDINVEIGRGEILGIIGKNGAGKSTLLKVLARITRPTRGRITYHGRMASLLEVGTGFHRELTGRENIFLNGSILGMKRREITRKFDEIVAFAEVEKFIDTPVKFYSSGMYVRLAFAVSAHLDPDIMIVDEVLAVGDAAFQKKCLGKMQDVGEHGRTVLFVSHNMAAIQTLCTRAILIDGGQIAADTSPQAAISKYLAGLQPAEDATLGLVSESGDLEIERVLIRNGLGQVTNIFQPADPLIVEVCYHARRPVKAPYFWLRFAGQWGPLGSANMLLDGARPEVLTGRGSIRCRFDRLPFVPEQDYMLRLGARGSDGRRSLISAADVGSFRVTGSARDVRLEGELADSRLASAPSLLLAYTWELPGGRTVTVTPTGTT